MQNENQQAIEDLKLKIQTLLKIALEADERNKGGFDGSQYKAWNNYDDALAELSKLMSQNNKAWNNYDDTLAELSKLMSQNNK